MDLLVRLKEFCRTEASHISRSQFRKVLRLLVSRGTLSEAQQTSLQRTFDRRENQKTFYEAVDQVKGLADDLLKALRKGFGPSVARRELLRSCMNPPRQSRSSIVYWTAR